VGLLDKVKDQAQVISKTATEAAQKGQEKLDALQAKRDYDDNLRKLGKIQVKLHHELMDAETANSETQKLMAAIEALESKYPSLAND
jgi:hypothetical protein